MKAHEEFLPWAQLRQNLDSMLQAIEANDVQQMRRFLADWVSGYQSEEGVADWVCLAT